MPMRGISRFSIENLMSHSTEKLRTGTVLGCDSENFRGRKSLQDMRGEVGSIRIFRRKFFVSTVPKKFVGESFSNSINSGIKKVYG